MGYLKLAGLLILLLLATPASAQNQALLVDRSGSMKPYYENNVVQDIGNKILSVLNADGRVQIVAFSTYSQNVADLNSITVGGDTLLDQAIQDAIAQKYSIVWMITDNLQHEPNAQNAGNTMAFYEKLRDKVVKKVAILPMLQSPGRPGIAVYVMLLSSSTESESLFNKEVNEFLKNKGQLKTEALQMKPLSINTVDIQIERSSLDTKKGKPYEVGQVVRETFSIRFKSKFDHLRITSANIEVPQLEADFGPESVLRHGTPKFSINPAVVKSLEPSKATDQIYEVEADLAEVQLKKDPISIWKAAFGKAKENHVLTLKFIINVPRKSFEFKQQFLDNYNSSTIADAVSSGKIYGIESLPSLLTEETTPIVSEIHIPVEVKYPMWPSIVIMIFFLLLAALVIGGVWFVMSKARGLIGKKRWTVKAATQYGAELESQIDNGQVYVQSDCMGELNSNKLHVAEGVTVLDQEDQKEKIPLTDGVNLKMKSPHGEIYVLTFNTVQSHSTEEQEGSFTPGRR
jgi:hypothetical protein